jgi:hypothetical protein
MINVTKLDESKNSFCLRYVPVEKLRSHFAWIRSAQDPEPVANLIVKTVRVYTAPFYV